MPSFTLIPSEAGAPINFTATVPVDDMNMVGFTATWLPDRPMTADDIPTIESWAGAYAEVDPRTFEPVANRQNDYLLDRKKQRTENFTACAVFAGRRNSGEGPIANPARSNGRSDAGVIALRRRLLKAARIYRQGENRRSPPRRRVSRAPDRQSHAP